jgi:hypothetical protein
MRAKCFAYESLLWPMSISDVRSTSTLNSSPDWSIDLTIFECAAAMSDVDPHAHSRPRENRACIQRPKGMHRRPCTAVMHRSAKAERRQLGCIKH